MDDYNISTIIESKNEWCARLVNMLTPCMIAGMKEVYNEANTMCIDSNEGDKYLVTFQNLLSNVAKWSSEIVRVEKDRIIDKSCCNYLEDLLTCVHIAQLKALTSSRVGIKQKKIDIDIPDLQTFIHRCYINIARQVYLNVYLFEEPLPPIQFLKNKRELEMIVKECILNTIRDNIPIENILRTYLDETYETDVEVKETREVIADDELIKKQAKEAKEKELEIAKQEVKDKIEKEHKLNLSEAIKNANKALNTSDLPASELKTINASVLPTSVTKQINTEIEPAINLDRGDIIDIKPDKLNIDSVQSSNVNLDIKHIDNDPDQLQFDKLDFDSVDFDLDLDLDLEIMELN
jgi:hypothetical protein